MSSQIEPYSFEGVEVRVVGEPEAPRFVVTDVCRVLELGNPTMAVAGLDADEKGVSTVETPGGPQEVLTVTEPGLYALLARSRKPAARRFDRWVRHEVLPAIRRTGSYGAPVPVETVEVLAIRAIEGLTAKVAEQRRQLDAAAPKVEAFHDLLDATGRHGLQEAAKLIGQPPNKWIAWMEQAGHLHRRGGHLVPRQEHIDAGRMTVKVRVVDGKEYAQAFVTAPGLAYFHARRPFLAPAQLALSPAQGTA